jgi:hypothetical protein
MVLFFNRKSAVSTAHKVSSLITQMQRPTLRELMMEIRKITIESFPGKCLVNIPTSNTTEVLTGQHAQERSINPSEYVVRATFPGKVTKLLTNPNSHDYPRNYPVLVTCGRRGVWIDKQKRIFNGNNLPDTDDSIQADSWHEACSPGEVDKLWEAIKITFNSPQINQMLLTFCNNNSNNSISYSDDFEAEPEEAPGQFQYNTYHAMEQTTKLIHTLLSLYTNAVWGGVNAKRIY